MRWDPHALLRQYTPRSAFHGDLLGRGGVDRGGSIRLGADELLLESASGLTGPMTAKSGGSTVKSRLSRHDAMHIGSPKVAVNPAVKGVVHVHTGVALPTAAVELVPKVNDRSGDVRYDLGMTQAP